MATLACLRSPIPPRPRFSVQANEVCLKMSRLSKLTDRQRWLVMARRWRPLLPQHSIYLQVRAGNGPRFVCIFRDTWKHIPIRDRRRMLRYWKDDGTKHKILLSPQIELIDRKNMPTADLAIAGVTSNWGHRIRFPADDFDRMPDSACADLIGHELAHAFQFASGFRICSEDDRHTVIGPDETIYDETLQESHANAKATEWGFDMNSVHRWWSTLSVE